MVSVAELKALIKKYKEQDCPAISKMKKAELIKFAQDKNLISDAKPVAKPVEAPVKKPVEKPVEKVDEKVAKKPGRKPKLFGEGMQKILAGKPLVDPELVNEYEKYKSLPKNYREMSDNEIEEWIAKGEDYEAREEEIKIYKKTGKPAAQQRKEAAEKEAARRRAVAESSKKYEAEIKKTMKPVNSKRVTDELVKMGVLK